MASLPSISQQVFVSGAGQGEIEPESPERESSAQVKAESDILAIESLLLTESDSSLDEVDGAEQSDDPTVDEDFDTAACPFCPHKSHTPTMTVQHLAQQHALTIPCLDRLTDLATFLGYLNTVVYRFHECIYCARQMHSAAAVRQHMVMKGHCRLDLSADSELLDFWELEDGQVLVDSEIDDRADIMREKIRRLAQAEMIMPSGAVVMPRTANSSKKHSQRRPLLSGSAKGLPSADRVMPRSESASSAGMDKQEVVVPGTAPSAEQALRPRRQAVARRNEMGLTGVTGHQRQALRAVERKMIKQESIARARYQWTIEKEGNNQKTFRPDNPGGRKNG
jgi:pre-60S factor REI1